MKSHLSQALALANKDFNLEIPETEVASTKEFQHLLSQLIRHLLDHDFERLLNGLYRIDVSEDKVKQAMASADNVAEAIALLIIEREMQKVVTREKYKH
jgi:hypothetical protein